MTSTLSKSLRALTMLSLMLGAQASWSAQCTQVSGEQSASVVASEQCDSTIGLCTRGRLLSGALEGAMRFSALEVAPGAGFGKPPYALASYTGELRIETKDGTLLIRNAGVFDPSVYPDGDGRFAEFGRVQSGTGRFEGASGALTFVGVRSTDGKGFTSRYSGEVCRNHAK